MYNKKEYKEKYILRALPNGVYIWFQFTKYSFQIFKPTKYNLTNISLSNLYQISTIYISIISLRNIFQIYLYPIYASGSISQQSPTWRLIQSTKNFILNDHYIIPIKALHNLNFPTSTHFVNMSAEFFAPSIFSKHISPSSTNLRVKLYRLLMCFVLE